VEVRIRLPRVVERYLSKLGVDPEHYLLDVLISKLPLDPEEELEVHIELARRFLNEGLRLVERDPVQASEKLYKAAEEAVKALIIRHKLTDIVERVRERGRWRYEDFFEGISRLRKIYGDDVRRWWGTAWELHVWGFHEAKASRQYLEERIEDVRKLVGLVESS